MAKGAAFGPWPGKGSGGGVGIGSSLAKFSGTVLTNAGAPTFSYLSDIGTEQIAPTANQADPLLYPSGARTITALIGCAPVGTGAQPPTFAVYKNGVATTMTVTLPASTGGRVVAITRVNPVTLVDGDSYDVRCDFAATSEGNQPVSAQIETVPAGAAGVASILTTVPGQTATPSTGAVVISGGGWARVANITALAALDAASFPIGNSWCWVDSVGAWFSLQTSALTTTPTTVITASGLIGGQWQRQNWVNHTWEARTTWVVNTATGNDENPGTALSPLKTLSECARRLAYAFLTGTTVTLDGSTIGGDVPNWTFQAKGFEAFAIVGSPTLLYSGNITAAVNVAAAPTTTENNLTDTAIPVSFTASGLLANGVLFQRTSGTPAQWWAMLDKGAKTIRTSQPNNQLTFTDQTFSVADTYTASQLPQTGAMYFAETNPLAIKLQNLLLPSVASNAAIFVNCCFVNATGLGGGYYLNCLFQGGTQMGGSVFGSGPQFVVNGGGIRGVGSTQWLLLNCQGVDIGNSRLTLQGGELVTQGGFTQISSDIVAYDISGPGIAAVSAQYWGIVVWSAGAFGGSNNSAIASVLRASQISHVTNPNWLAGSSTSGTPINIAGTGTISVAAETAGGGVMNTQQNGIFPTS